MQELELIYRVDGKVYSRKFADKKININTIATILRMGLQRDLITNGKTRTTKEDAK